MKGALMAIYEGKETELRIQNYVRRAAEVKCKNLLHKRMSNTGEQ